jgi:hypothetical protein
MRTTFSSKTDDRSLIFLFAQQTTVTQMVWLDPTAINLANFNKDCFILAIHPVTFPSASVRRI